MNVSLNFQNLPYLDGTNTLNQERRQTGCFLFSRILDVGSLTALLEV